MDGPYRPAGHEPVIKKFLHDTELIEVTTVPAGGGFLSLQKDAAGRSQKLTIDSFAITGPSSFSIQIARGMEQGYFVCVEDEIFCTLEGKTYHFRTPDAAQEGASSGACRSPLPGRVIKIVRRPGELIEAGATIIVIEAMKMEHSIKAALGGVIKELNCQAGQVVSQDEILALVEPPPA